MERASRRRSSTSARWCRSTSRPWSRRSRAPAGRSWFTRRPSRPASGPRSWRRCRRRPSTPSTPRSPGSRPGIPPTPPPRWRAGTCHRWSGWCRPLAARCRRNRTAPTGQGTPRRHGFPLAGLASGAGDPSRSLLAPGTPVRPARLGPLLSGGDPGAAAGAGTTPPAVHRGGPAGREAAREGPGGDVRAQRVSDGAEEVAELLVAQLGARPPGVEPPLPETLALVDVADAAADPLVQEQLSERGGAERPCPSDHLVQPQIVPEKVRPQVADRLLGLPHQLDDRGCEADRHSVAKVQDGARLPLGPPPSLGLPVQVPRASHPHV